MGPDLVKNSKPHPEAIEKVLLKTDSTKETTVIVGDSPTDILAGKAAGINTCGAFYGLSPFEELRASKPDTAIEHLTDLLLYYN